MGHFFILTNTEKLVILTILEIRSMVLSWVILAIMPATIARVQFPLQGLAPVITHMKSHSRAFLTIFAKIVHVGIQGIKEKNDHSSDRPHHWANMPGLQLVTFLWNRWEDPNWSGALISHSVSNPSPKSRWRVWSNRQSSPSSWKSNSRCSRDSPGLRVFWVPRKWFEYNPSRR